LKTELSRIKVPELNACLFVHNFFLSKGVQGALDIVMNPTKWAVVLLKGGRSQVYYGLGLSSTS